MDAQALVNAQVLINRSVFEMNRRYLNPPIQKEPDPQYILEQIEHAISELKKVKISITGQR